MAYLLNRIQASLAKEGLKPRTNAARAWIRSKVKDLNSKTALMRAQERLRTNTIIGKMYFFYYDPKTKDSLPYYDRFPLVIPIDQYSDGFLGLNLHYIHPKQRIILLDKLSDTLTNKRFNERTRLRVNYEYLKAASIAFEAMPCIKRYLFANVESRFLEISADEWDIAVMLPMETFVGASAGQVYSESRKKF